LVEKEGEEGVGLSRYLRFAPWSNIKKDRKKLSFNEWGGFMLLSRL
jgi:hypothetical protein